MTNRERTENESFFSNMLDNLMDGGAFVWKDLGEILVKRNGKFEASPNAYNILSYAVSPKYFTETFTLKQELL